jgi:hypothetical protein
MLTLEWSPVVLGEGIRASFTDLAGVLHELDIVPESGGFVVHWSHDCLDLPPDHGKSPLYLSESGARYAAGVWASTGEWPGEALSSLIGIAPDGDSG